MSWNQIAENWNGQVTKLYNWTINRLESAADKSDVKKSQTDYPQPSVKPGIYADQEESHEIRH
ncbi:MAG: hypothetical protein P4L43_05425 [Syntrophobacteraceae bacterium]|nr:hypothetical protein [Syntrophobacteraceae bacterium]